MGDKNIAWVHIGMEETIAEYLSEENFNAALGQYFHIGILSFQCFEVCNRNAVNTLAHHHAGASEIPIDFRYVDKVGTVEIAS